MITYHIFQPFGFVLRLISRNSITDTHIFEEILLSTFKELLSGNIISSQSVNNEGFRQRIRIFWDLSGCYLHILTFQKITDAFGWKQTSHIVCQETDELFQKSRIANIFPLHYITQYDSWIYAIYILHRHIFFQRKIYQVRQSAEMYVFLQRVIIIRQLMKLQEFKVGKTEYFEFYIPTAQFIG